MLVTEYYSPLAAYYYSSDPAISFHSSPYDSIGYFLSDGPLQGQHQHGLDPVPSGYYYSHYDDCLGHYEHHAQPPIPPILPSSSSSELGYALVETPPPKSRPINHGSIALPSPPMPSSSAPKHGQSKTLVGSNPVKTEYAGVNGQPLSPMTHLAPSRSPASWRHIPLARRAKSIPMFSPLQRGHMVTRIIVRFVRRLMSRVIYAYLADSDALFHPPSRYRGNLLIHLARVTPRLLSSSFSSSDIGAPTSSIHLDTNAASSSQVPPPASAPNPKAGQGVLKLPSIKRSACLFCHEWKIACGAPPHGKR
ncbi:hypothetical protein EDB84DRAFT_1679105 [Lactarius hengduanensis]|nr:hypothetical protein EDB84DRAFT_1679105 [Lactarius hengduanensis]